MPELNKGKFKQFGERALAFVSRHPSLDKKFTLLIGSVRSSKTWAVSAKLIVHLNDYEVEGRRVICGKTKGQVYKNILIDLFEMVGQENYSYNRSSGELWLFGKQWFVLGAHDDSAYTTILGMTIGIFVADEVVEYPESFFMQIPLRMSPDGARFYGTTNPGNPVHYLKLNVIDNPKWASQLDVQTFTLDDNPNVSTEAKRTIIASQVGVFKQRFIYGRWVAAQGAIYRDAWSEELLYDDTDRPETLYAWNGHVDNIVFVDYGTVNPFVAIEALDDGRTLWLDREYWWDSAKEMRQKTDAQYADDLVQWLSPTGWRDSNGILSVSSIVNARRALPRIVVDPSAASFIAELENRGLWVVHADNDVSDGIRKMSTVMVKKLLRIHRERCPHGLLEIPAYMWDDKAAKVGEEKPIKTNDHWCDASRYGVKEVFSDFRLMAA